MRPFVVVAAGVLLWASIAFGGQQIIIGGFDPGTHGDTKNALAGLEKAMPQFQKLGVTSHEVYVRWNLCEPEEGKWDWSAYDGYVELYKKHNLKWVPFLICGSAYSLPDWYYKKPGSQGYVCLEHGTESDVQSLWNPEMRKHVADFLKAFCEHYRDSGTIESILLGVTGNYGEAIYIATPNDDWTADVHGKFHTHPGFWAGDPFAEASFKKWVKDKYGTTEKLRAAWGEKAPAIEDVKPFLKKNNPANDRAWIDFVDWYTESMTDYAKFWLTETRKNFPKGDIYLCTGGHAPPPHGADFAEQTRIAAEIGGGVRITNEASDYELNFSLTRWVASGAQQYGAYYSFEPAGGVNAAGVVVRVYNAAASGARGLHYYWPNIADSEAATENFIRNVGVFHHPHKPVTEIAVFYPSTYIKLHGQNFLEPLRPLRDRFDFNYASEKQIRDGALKNAKALIVMQTDVMERETSQAISKWLKDGGLLVRTDKKLHTVEGGDVTFDDVGHGAILGIDAEGKSEKFRQFAADVLAKAPQLSPQSRAMVAADGKEDGLFVTLVENDTLLWLNSTDKDQSASTGTKLPRLSINSAPLAKH